MANYLDETGLTLLVNNIKNNNKWVSESNNTAVLKVNGTDKTISLNGHTHSGFLTTDDVAVDFDTTSDAPVCSSAIEQAITSGQLAGSMSSLQLSNSQTWTSTSKYVPSIGNVMGAIKWGDNNTSGSSALNLYGTSKKVSLNGHTHSYLPLAGGSLTGDLTVSVSAAGTRSSIYVGPANDDDDRASVSSYNQSLDLYAPGDIDITSDGGTVTIDGYNLGPACAKDFSTTVASGDSKLITSGAVYTAIQNATGGSGGSHSYPLQDFSNGGPSYMILTPNKFYLWGEMDELEINFNDPEAGVTNEYIFQFTSGSEPTTLIIDEDIRWSNGAPSIEANTIYQVSILNKCATIAGFAL